MRRAIYLALSCLLTLIPDFAFAGQRIALVVGNSAYRNIPELVNPGNDAKLMAATLRALGFTLVGDGPQLNLGKAEFDKVIQAFGQSIQGAEAALFYFAGHGMQLRDTNYLAPVNATLVREADVDFQMVDVGLVLRQMEGSGTRLNIVILDACRDNPFRGRGVRSSGRGLVQMQAPEGTLISYATQPGRVALDGDEANSPYTKALAETLPKSGLGIFDVFNAVGLTVKQRTRGEQQPWVSSSPIAGSFYFAGAFAADAPSVDPAAQTWSAIENTDSPDVLHAFIKQYPEGIYAEMAKARLRKQESQQAALTAPANQLSPPQQTQSSSQPPSSSKPLRVLEGHSDKVTTVAFSQEGDLLASGSTDKTVKLWKATSGKLLRTLQGTDPVNALAFSPDGSLLAWTDGFLVRLWDVARGRQIRSLEGHLGYVLAVAFSPDGFRLASGSFDKTVRVWDVASGKLLLKFTGHSDAVMSVAFTSDAIALASGGHDAVKMWNATSGKVIWSINAANSFYHPPLVFLGLKKPLVTAYNNEIFLLDPTNARFLKTFSGHSQDILSVAVNLYRTQLASGGFDKLIRIWDVETGALQQTFESGSVHSVSFSPDGTILASGGNDNFVKFWAVSAAKTVNR